jgi:hypothetical protein
MAYYDVQPKTKAGNSAIARWFSPDLEDRLSWFLPDLGCCHRIWGAAVVLPRGLRSL